MKAYRIIALAIVTSLCLPDLVAQENEEDTKPYWYASFCTIEWSRIDSLKQLKKRSINRIAEAAVKKGIILDYKMFFHHTGNVYNVVILTRHNSWCSIEKNWFSATYKEMEPDEKKRKAFWDAYLWVFEGSPHYDCIYIE